MATKSTKTSEMPNAVADKTKANEDAIKISNDFYAPVRPLGSSVESEVTYKTTVGIINGKCAWCGIDASDLPMSHFEQHETEDKLKNEKPLCNECGTNDERDHTQCHDEEMRKRHPIPEKKEVKSKYTHEQLLEALYWIFDVFERANMNFFLVYSTADAVLQKRGLEGDKVEVGVRKLEWLSGARGIVDAFAQYESDEGEIVRYVAPNGVPVILKAFRDDPCISSPDTVIYQQEYFRLPNPYSKFLEVFEK